MFHCEGVQVWVLLSVQRAFLRPSFGYSWCVVGNGWWFSIRMVNPPHTIVWCCSGNNEFLQGGWLDENGIGIGGKRRKWGALRWTEHRIVLLYQHTNLAFYADGGSIPPHPTKPSQVLLRLLLYFLVFCTWYWYNCYKRVHIWEELWQNQNSF